MGHRAWPHLRALLIFFHIAAVLLTCTPLPGKVLDRGRWKSEETQAQFRAWSSRLASVGIDTTAAELEAWLWARGQDYAAVRRVLVRPFERYTRTLHLAQGWALFASPQRHPTRVVVELHTPGEGWRTLTWQRSEVFDWKKEQLDNHRLRKLTGRIARTRRPHMYRRLADWMARAAAREFPAADRLRVQLFRYRTGAPGVEPRLRDARFTDVRDYRLESYR